VDAKNPLNRHGVNRAQNIRKFHLKISELTTRGARKLKHYVYGPFQSFIEILKSKLKNKCLQIVKKKSSNKVSRNLKNVRKSYQIPNKVFK
jgi:hypothetical protein